MKKEPDGFIYYPNFIDEQEERNIIQELQNLSWQEVKLHGVTAKRRVVHFGFDYTYTTRSITPTTPAPSFLHPLMQRSAQLLQVPTSEIAETLISEYPAGAGIGWHRDARVFEKIVGVSLLSECIIKLRREDQKGWQVYKTKLEPRSAYILTHSARDEWQHAIPPVKAKRYSITFRTLKNANDK